ncbi:MAG TPA: methyltransferase [Allosphingosinicella sp.]|jgi:predicted methyltransferase
MKKIQFAVAIMAAFALTSSAQGQRASRPSRSILAAVADPTRPAEDAARDPGRKPAEIVAFAGVRPGDRIVELAPGGGYYTRILARSVGPRGHVYAVVTPGFAARPEAMDRFRRVVAGYPNVEIVVSDFRTLTMARLVDMVWTSENYHDFHNVQGADLAVLNRAVFNLLRPGGAYYVEDHAAPGTGVTATSTLHRIDPQTVRDEVRAAGFRLEAESPVLVNPADPHTARSNDASIRGRTDRFAMRFRKPAR